MKNDDYIFGYLDGELSPEENELLRKLTANDPLTKEEFDSSVFIHCGMKVDADIVDVPEDLFAETECLVLDAMKRNQPPVVTSPTRLRRRTASLAVVLLLSVVQVTDSWIQKGALVLKGVPFPTIQEVLSKSTSTHPVSTVAHQQSNGEHFDATNVSLRVLDELSSERVASPNTVNTHESASELASEEVHESSVSANQFVVQEPSLTEPLRTAAFGSNVQALSTVPSFSQTTPRVMQLSSVEFSTFVGEAIGFKGNERPIHFSQSFAVPVGEKEKIGLEVGYLSFSKAAYRSVVEGSNGILQSQAGESLTSLESGHSKLNGAEGIDGAGATGNGSGMFVTPNQADGKSLLWVSAFLDKEFVQVENVAVQGRLGVGFSGEGTVLSGKAFTSVDIWKGLILTAGTEGLIYQLDTKNTSTGNSTMHTMFSVVYGLQYRF